MTQETIPGTKVIGERIARAQIEFLETLQELGGISQADAVKAFNTMRKLRVVKYDGMRYRVKHGGFLDRDVILRAVTF